MTRGSIREYTDAVRGRYLRASKKEKSRILDEFIKVIGCQSPGATDPATPSSKSAQGEQKARPSPAIRLCCD